MNAVVTPVLYHVLNLVKNIFFSSPSTLQQKSLIAAMLAFWANNFFCPIDCKIFEEILLIFLVTSF